MKEKLIITLWKAQLSIPFQSDSIYCLLTYNESSKTTKQLQSKTSLQWKQTFIFPLAKQELPFKIDFISLKKGEEIHFAHNNLAQSLSIAKATLKIPVKSPTKGSLPAKLDIIDQQNGLILGKVFIQYEVLKTQVAYLIQKMMDYDYMLKLSNFKVTFLRVLKKVPTFYLKLKYGQKVHRQDFPFYEQNGNFFYTYPIKLYMNKQIEMNIELQVKQFFGIDSQNAKETMKSASIITDKRSDMSALLKRSSNSIIDFSVDTKISGLLDLTFKESVKTTKKISLTTYIKNQQRQIGSLEFQVQTIFKTPEEKQALEEQKRGVKPKDNPQYLTQRKRRPSNAPNLQQSNGYIVLNTIMGKLQLSQQDSRKIQGRDLSLSLRLGKQSDQSSVLQNPGKQLIFLDTFTFKRTWQQIIKFVLEINQPTGAKIPIFFASVNLRQLFETGRMHAKKIKIYDEMKNYCGTFILDMQYKQQEKKPKEKSPGSQRKLSQDDMKQKLLNQKRQKINQRMKDRQDQKKSKLDSSRSMSLNKQRDIITMAQALDLKDLILPPLKNRKFSNQVNNSVNSTSRYSTLSPSKEGRQEKFRSANVFNSNGRMLFSKSPRFDQKLENNKSGDSFTLVRQSDFDVGKKRGAHIGYGDKYDFTSHVKHNPGIGKYQIPSLWDKYQ